MVSPKKCRASGDGRPGLRAGGGRPRAGGWAARRGRPSPRGSAPTPGPRSYWRPRKLPRRSAVRGSSSASSWSRRSFDQGFGVGHGRHAKPSSAAGRTLPRDRLEAPVVTRRGINKVFTCFESGAPIRPAGGGTMASAIITGGSQGLGRALADTLAELGWHVVIDARHAGGPRPGRGRAGRPRPGRRGRRHRRVPPPGPGRGRRGPRPARAGGQQRQLARSAPHARRSPTTRSTAGATCSR